MFKYKRILIGCLLTLLMVATPEEIRASNENKLQDAEDLYEIYNKQQEKEYQEALGNYNKLKEAYEEVQEDIHNKEVFNKLYDEAKEKQLQEVNEINQEIEVLMKENQEIADKIAMDIQKDWDNLIGLDKQYQINLDNIDFLIAQINSMKLIEKKDIDYEELDLLELEFQEQTSKFEINEDSKISVLGEVTNVRYPLNADTVVTSEFGNRIDPMTGNTIRFHSGLDLRAKMGTEVISIFNGVVEDVGYGALGGYYVKINHGNNIISYYCHLSEILCEKNQTITQYDVIALSGNTGSRTTGPHLHFGLYLKGNPVDPQKLFE